MRTKNGDPFAGVLLNIRQRGVDTAMLLRNELLRTSVEMWFKVYSPLVDSVEIVQRRQKRARRARLTYMRYVINFLVDAIWSSGVFLCICVTSGVASYA